MAEMGSELPMITPYMYHYYVEALLHCGMKDEAVNVIRNYWGGMVNEGADTFWELYNPANPDESPLWVCDAEQLLPCVELYTILSAEEVIEGHHVKKEMEERKNWGGSQGLSCTYEQAHVDLDLLTLASLK